MSEKKKDALLQGGILAGAGLITKIIGFAYRIPMGNMMGEEGNGIYSVAFGIYNIALTISSYSLPLAVSKMVSARIAKEEYKNKRKVVLIAMLYALIAGIIIMAGLYFGANALESMYHKQGLARPLRILAPTTFIVAILGVFRGYFQGHGDMVPTSLSQIVEQIANAIVSVLATWQFLRIHAQSKEIASYGAAGGTLGTLAGAGVALVFMVGFFMTTRARYHKRRRRSERVESNSSIMKALCWTILPVVLSQTIYQIGYTIDDFMFGRLMPRHGYEDKVITSLQGVFNTQYNQLINLPVAIASSMAASILPSIVVSRMQNDMWGMHQKTTQIIKVNMVIAFPSAIGLSVMAEPIMQMMFPRLVTYQHEAVMLLVTGSCAIVFYALSALTTSVLQGNNYMKLPVIYSAISLGIHIILLGILLYFTDLNIYALVICNVLFPLIVSALNCHAITTKVGYQWEFLDTFIKPFLAAAAMGIEIYAVYHVVQPRISNIYVSSMIAIVPAVIIYAVVILQIGCFSEDELEALPGGSKLLRFLP